MSNLYSSAEKIGELLARELEQNPHFYFFSPDETTSNKFSAVFESESRAWNLPTLPWDLPESPNGRIVELLSENVLFSVMTGHLMNNEPAMFGSYEAFYPIITSQLLQQIKFIKQSDRTSWRPKYPAVNLLSTSTCWRQDHNGFTHQSPALISTLLAHPSDLSNCFFPTDDLSAETIFNFMLTSKNVVNFTTFNKIPLPRYLNFASARQQFQDSGVYLHPEPQNLHPDIIFVSVGDLQTSECEKARAILTEDLPFVQIRHLSLSALSYRAIGPIHDKLAKSEFNHFFTETCPIIANFHGYPETFETILENYTSRSRLRVHGYSEEGSTTTPFEMLRRNAASRFDLAIDVAKLANRPDLVKKYQNILAANHAYAVANGEDMLE